ncbi:hypothetical protein OC842_007979, partial [Tilletia horrida]
ALPGEPVRREHLQPHRPVGEQGQQPLHPLARAGGLPYHLCRRPRGTADLVQAQHECLLRRLPHRAQQQRSDFHRDRHRDAPQSPPLRPECDGHHHSARQEEQDALAQLQHCQC